jgi:homoserine kinase
LQLLKFAMEGEIVASGSAHIDNIAPCLFGGLVLTVGIDHPRVKQIPVPPSLRCVLVHPAYVSGHARGARHFEDRRHALGFRLADRESRGLHQRLLFERSGHDSRFVQRRHHRAAAPFADPRVQGRAARRHVRRRLGCSISGAGPTIFAWAEIQHAEAVRGAMVAAFTAHGLKSDYWISSLENYGARVVKA